MSIPDMRQAMDLFIMYGLSSMFVFFGAFIYEMYLRYKNYSHRIAIDRLLMSTIVGSVVALFVISEIGHRFAFVQCLAIAFLIGLLGFQILVKISRLDFWIELYNRFRNK